MRFLVSFDYIPYGYILNLPNCESELNERLLRGHGHSPNSRVFEVCSQLAWSEIINLANVFAHKGEFVAFQETLRANTRLQQDCCTFCFLDVTPGMNTAALGSVFCFRQISSLKCNFNFYCLRMNAGVTVIGSIQNKRNQSNVSSRSWHDVTSQLFRFRSL